jgi:hypothetical protein
MGRTWHSQVYDAAVAQSTVTLRRIGERADSPEGERAFVALLGFLHGGVAVGGVAVLGWCCCRSCGCASGTDLPIAPPGQQAAAENLAAASTQPPPPGVSDSPGAEPVSSAGAAAAAPGSSAAVAERSASEEARLLSWSITYLRELATSILQMDARIDRGVLQSQRRLRLTRAAATPNTACTSVPAQVFHYRALAETERYHGAMQWTVGWRSRTSCWSDYWQRGRRRPAWGRPRLPTAARAAARQKHPR